MPETSRAVLWNGFDLSWGRGTHRLSTLVSRLVGAEGDDASHQFAAGRPENDDVADYMAPWRALRTTSAFVGVGRVESMVLPTYLELGAEFRRIVRVPLGSLASETRPPSFRSASADHAGAVDAHTQRPDREDLHGGAARPLTSTRDREGAVRAAVLLNGFSLRNLTVRGHDAGWHFGGLGVRAERVRFLGNDTVQFDLVAWIRPASLPGAADDAPFVNLAETKYELTVDYVVVVGTEDRIAFADAELSATARRTCATDQTVKGSVTGRPGLPGAVPGLRGFELTLSSPWFLRHRLHTGRPLRALGAALTSFSYDARTGRCDLTGRLRCSDEESELYRESLPFRFDGRLLVTVVQLADDAETIEGEVRGAADAGPTITEDPLSTRSEAA